MLGYSHLSAHERGKIYSGLCNQKSLRNIAKTIDRDASTISREVRRHRDHIGYHPAIAREKKLAPKKSRWRVDKIPELKAYILEKLDAKYSPNVIAGRWNREHPDTRISAETIYTWVYGSDEGRRLELYKKLPRAKPKRGMKRRRRRGSKIKDRTPIAQRPEAINQRSEVGHVECDLVFYSGSASINVLTVVDRLSRYSAMFINRSKHTEEVMGKAVLLAQQWHIKSATFDNGLEFADHGRLKEVGIDTYFCEPHSPWEKGSIEQYNGMLRYSLPFQVPASSITQDMLDGISYNFNHTPRKILDFETPCEVFSRGLQGENIGCCA